MIIALTVSRVGRGRVKPSLYFRPTAQPISNKPANNKMIQDIEPTIFNAEGPSRDGHSMSG